MGIDIPSPAKPIKSLVELLPWVKKINGGYNVNREIITNSQAVKIMIMFIGGSSLILGTATDCKQDAWIAILIGMAFSLPIIIVYSRIILLFPGKDLFCILENVFGKYTW